jgi:lysophospholipase L1-like esterase
LVQEFYPSQSDCCLLFLAQRLADQLQDWNQLGRYHEDSQRVGRQPQEKGRVVFLGDSITDGWKLAQYFPGKPYVNRGISGQTTPQMLVRMFPDVINLRPAALIILAGTNDIARNTGPETAEMIEDNFRAMSELAEKHDIKVILCLLLPVSDYTPSKQTTHRPSGDILKLNDWLRNYATEIHAPVADYYSALVDEHGMLREGYSDDGLHPNDRGYTVMAPIAVAAIEKALKE